MQEATIRGTLAGGSELAQPESQLQTSLNAVDDQLGKLGSMFGELEDRLAPIRNQLPKPDENRVSDMPPVSPVVNHVCTQVSAVMSLQRRLSDLLSELEV